MMSTWAGETRLMKAQVTFDTISKQTNKQFQGKTKKIILVNLFSFFANKSQNVTTNRCYKFKVRKSLKMFYLKHESDVVAQG